MGNDCSNGRACFRSTCSSVRCERDAAWIERELGDVAHDRVIGATCHDNPLSWVARGDEPYLGMAFTPVESLGRDA